MDWEEGQLLPGESSEAGSGVKGIEPVGNPRLFFLLCWTVVS